MIFSSNSLSTTETRRCSSPSVTFASLVANIGSTLEETFELDENTVVGAGAGGAGSIVGWADCEIEVATLPGVWDEIRSSLKLSGREGAVAFPKLESASVSWLLSRAIQTRKYKQRCDKRNK